MFRESKFSKCLLGLILLLAITVPDTGPAKENFAPDGIRWRFHKPRRFFVIGDLHGDSDAYLAILTHLNLIDGRGDPTKHADDAYIADTGDHLSKGPNSRFLLDYEEYLSAKMEARHGRLDSVEGNQDFEAVIRPQGKIPPEDVQRYGEFILPLDPGEVIRELARQTHLLGRYGLTLDAESEEMVRNAQVTAQYYAAFRRAMTSDPVYYNAGTQKNIFLQYPRTLIVHGGFSKAMEDFTPEDAGRMNAAGRAALRELFAHVASGSQDPPPELPWFMRGQSGPMHTRAVSTGQISQKVLREDLRQF